MNLHDGWPAGIPRPRDYLETADGLFLAVVSSALDEGHALTSLRYVRRGGTLVKLGTDDANRLLQRERPAWLVHSALIDAMIHLVPLQEVVRVHRPDDRLAALRASGDGDALERRALQAVEALSSGGAPVRRLGLGGSLLLGAQHADSDIDLVAYGRQAFQAARAALGSALELGKLEALDAVQWEAAWARRGSDLTLAEYIAAEVRKRNKAVIEGTRVDLTLVVDRDEEVPEHGPFRKLGRLTLRAEVTDAVAGFDHPARFRVRHDAVAEVVSFTPTYTGQAVAGELIEASGWLEVDATGARRLVVGTSREAQGEYLRRVRRNSDSGRRNGDSG